MIAITGAAGFIASNLTSSFNAREENQLIVVDDFTNEQKNKNLHAKEYFKQIDREEFITWLSRNHQSVDFIFHLGARTDTAEFDRRIFEHLNLGYSKMIWAACSEYSIPLVYASSAATYGLGEFGYRDDHALVTRLKPLNPYGESKNEFDKWVLEQQKRPPYWIGLKFFNVYGPNEYHKGRMASVVFHAYNQIKETGRMNLFRSHRSGIADGEQKRDFIYAMDAVKVMLFFYQNRLDSGIYNVGTGKARSFLDLTRAVFNAVKLKPNIEYIDTPTDIRGTYQYFTEACMEKLYRAGYKDAFVSLEEGIRDYVQNYLIPSRYK